MEEQNIFAVGGFFADVRDDNGKIIFSASIIDEFGEEDSFINLVIKDEISSESVEGRLGTLSKTYGLLRRKKKLTIKVYKLNSKNNNVEYTIEYNGCKLSSYFGEPLSHGERHNEQHKFFAQFTFKDKTINKSDIFDASALTKHIDEVKKEFVGNRYKFNTNKVNSESPYNDDEISRGDNIFSKKEYLNIDKISKNLENQIEELENKLEEE